MQLPYNQRNFLLKWPRSYIRIKEKFSKNVKFLHLMWWMIDKFWADKHFSMKFHKIPSYKIRPAIFIGKKSKLHFENKITMYYQNYILLIWKEILKISVRNSSHGIWNLSNSKASQCSAHWITWDVSASWRTSLQAETCLRCLQTSDGRDGGNSSSLCCSGRMDFSGQKWADFKNFPHSSSYSTKNHYSKQDNFYNITMFLL